MRINSVQKSSKSELSSRGKRLFKVFEFLICFGHRWSCFLWPTQTRRTTTRTNKRTTVFYIIFCLPPFCPQKQIFTGHRQPLAFDCCSHTANRQAIDQASFKFKKPLWKLPQKRPQKHRRNLRRNTAETSAETPQKPLQKHRRNVRRNTAETSAETQQKQMAETSQNQISI